MKVSLSRIPSSVWLISIASSLITSSSAMLFSVFALFLNSIGVEVKHIVLIDGIVEGLGYILKVSSGIISDYLQKRTKIFALGTLFTAISRTIILLFMNFPGAIIARILDRLGNGLQATPRDALIGDYAPSEIKGTCFGIRQGFGAMGSVIGSIIVAFLLRFYTNNFQLVFFIASLPAISAFLIIVFCIRDPQNLKAKQGSIQRDNQSFWLKICQLGKSYWFLMITVAIFMLCRFSESLIILHGKKHFHLGNENAIWIMVIYNLASSISAYYSGRIADKVQAYYLIISGTLITSLANILIIISAHYVTFLSGVICWGVQIGLMQSVFCSEITSLVPRNLRGTGFGFFYLISAISLLTANIIANRLINFSDYYAFIYGVIISLIACFITIRTKRVHLIT